MTLLSEAEAFISLEGASISRSQILGGAYIALAAMLWGSLGIAGKIGYVIGSTPETLMLWRAVLLLPISIPLFARCSRKSILAAYSLLVITPMFLLYFYAVKLAGASTTAMILYTAPVIVSILSPRILGEKPSRSLWAILVTSVSGAILVGMGSPRTNPLGLILAATTALSYSAYITVARMLAKMGVTSSCLGIAPMAPAVLGFLVAAVLDASPLLPSSIEELAVEAYLAYACTGLAYYLYAQGIRRIIAPRAGVLSLIEPVTAYVLAVLLLGEEAPILKNIGAIIVVSSVGLAMRSKEN